ncbi:MAG: cupin domain-containing protein [Gammaproteobacteria bacterium]
MMKIYLVLIALILLPLTTVQAHEEDKSIVPDAEREIARDLHADGPAQNHGIESVMSLGQVALAGEFDNVDDRVLRTREITIAPGGVVAVHQHDARPGVAYIIEGEIIEYRNDEPEPVLRRAGDAAFEKTGVTHWWENKSDSQVRALIVDIVPAE